MAPAWNCACEECGQTWSDMFPEDEEDMTCPYCGSEAFDAVRAETSAAKQTEGE